MADWKELAAEKIKGKTGKVSSSDDIMEKWGWVESKASFARGVLSSNHLQEVQPSKLYSELNALSFSGCKIRITNLGRENNAERIRESLLKLVSTKGGFEEKFYAAKFPQAGKVTLTELLCLYRPMRFAIRNSAFTKALAGIVPLYGKKALDELPYEEYLDICRELSKIIEDIFSAFSLCDWAKEHRFLLLYAVLTEN
jgi:hypothetical protein